MQNERTVPEDAGRAMKLKLYKLTDEHDRSYGGRQWGEGVCHKTSGKGDLYGPDWTHWHNHPLLAVFLNAGLGQFDLATAHLWEGHDGGGEVKSDHGLRVGCTHGTTVRRVELPKVAHEAYVRFAIGCAWQVERNPKWRSWARNWLSGDERAAVYAIDAIKAVDAASAKAYADTVAKAKAVYADKAKAYPYANAVAKAKAAALAYPYADAVAEAKADAVAYVAAAAKTAALAAVYVDAYVDDDAYPYADAVAKAKDAYAFANPYVYPYANAVAAAIAAALAADAVAKADADAIDLIKLAEWAITDETEVPN